MKPKQRLAVAWLVVGVLTYTVAWSYPIFLLGIYTAIGYLIAVTWPWTHSWLTRDTE